MEPPTAETGSPPYMLCSELSIRKDGHEGGIAIPLWCRSWGCEWCAPRRRAQAIEEALSGRPERFLTLTTRPTATTTPEQRAAELASAWRKVAQRIRRQFQQPVNKRWPLKNRPRVAQTADNLRRIIAQDDKHSPPTLEYFAVVEATKAGEPHLHILLRSRYIPQDWLSEQMDKLLNSPIVDIRKINSRGKAAAYVSKYIGKAPHRFGTTKRYWHSTGWRLEPRQTKDNDHGITGYWYVEQRTVNEIAREWDAQGRTITYNSDWSIQWTRETNDIYSRAATWRGG